MILLIIIELIQVHANKKKIATYNKLGRLDRFKIVEILTAIVYQNHVKIPLVSIFHFFSGS